MASSEQVEMLAAQVTQLLAAAKKDLLQRMEEAGLSSSRGWRLSEELRHTIEGTEWVFRPVHMRERSPQDMEERVAIDHDGCPIPNDASGG
jgi:hypothetical protein